MVCVKHSKVLDGMASRPQRAGRKTISCRAQDMRVHRHGRLAESHVQHHIGRL